MATHYYTVTWDQLHRDARALAWRLMEKGPFTGIVAITRGGLIPAAIIARELDVRLVETVSIVTYAAGSGGSLIEEEKRNARASRLSIPFALIRTFSTGNSKSEVLPGPWLPRISEAQSQRMVRAIGGQRLLASRRRCMVWASTTSTASSLWSARSFANPM